MSHYGPTVAFFIRQAALQIKRCNGFLLNPNIFSLNRVGTNREFGWLMGIAALLGILYGVFVSPFWSEPVDFAQVWAGLIDYNKSPWGGPIFDVPSLQITIPALLLLIGFPVWPLCLAATGFFCALSFSAVTAASFAFTRNSALSLIFSLMLLSYIFSYSHGYPVGYPVGYWQFGQTGQYFALLGLSLLACGWPIAAGIVGGLLGGVHFVWCVGFVIAAFPIAAWLQSKIFKPFVFSFTTTLFFSMILMHYGNSVMPAREHYKYIFPSIPVSAVTNAKIVSDKESLQSVKKTTKIDIDIKRNKQLNPFQNKVWRGHNVIFSDAALALNAAFAFFLPEIIFVLLCLSFYCVQRTSMTADSDKFIYARRLLAMVVIPLVAAGLFQFLEQMDPSFHVLSLLNQQLPGLAQRAIINRWLNLSLLLIPIMTFSLLIILIRDKRSWMAVIGLIMIFKFIRDNSYWFFIPQLQSNNLLAVELFSVASIFYCLIALKKPIFNSALVKNSQMLIVIFVGLFFFNGKMSQLIHSAIDNRKFTGSDSADSLVATAKGHSGPILLSPGVVGNGGFNPQLRTNRPIIVPGNINVYDQATKTIIEVFCSWNQPTFEEFYAKVQPCFESRSSRQWAVISKEMQATGLITPDTWKLKIVPTITGGGFSYYHLAELTLKSSNPPHNDSPITHPE